MKFCKDCKYAEPKKTFFGREDYNRAICKHKLSAKVTSDYYDHLVTGKGKTEYYLCRTQRNSDCGIEAKFFEAK